MDNFEIYEAIRIAFCGKCENVLTNWGKGFLTLEEARESLLDLTIHYSRAMHENAFLLSSESEAV